MIQKMRRNGVLQVIVLALMALAVIVAMVRTCSMELYSAQVLACEEPGRSKLVLTGIELLRARELYLNGKLVADCDVMRISYQECHVMLDTQALVSGDWYCLELGDRVWGFLPMKSTPIWIQWPEQERAY